MPILDLLSKSLSKGPSVATLQSRVNVASAKFDTADQAWRNATLSSEETGDHSIEDAALKAKETAKKDLARLQAALEQAEARDASDALATEKVRQASEDAAAIQAFDDLAKATRAAAPAIAAYVTAYMTMEAAAQHAISKASPRTRQDLLISQSLTELVATELARVSTGALVPGARFPTTSRDTASLTPLTDHFDLLATTIKQELQVAAAGVGH